MRLTEVEPRDVKSYVVKLAESGLSPASVRNAIAPVRALFATAVEEGLIRSNPAAGLRIAQRVVEAEEGARVKALSEEELRRLLDELPEDWQLFFTLVAHTGVRISEAVGWRWATWTSALATSTCVDASTGATSLRRSPATARGRSRSHTGWRPP